MSLMWCVTQISPGEVHVFPLEEQHILDARLCNCAPEIRFIEGGKMVVHKKLGKDPLKPRVRAHWIQ